MSRRLPSALEITQAQNLLIQTLPSHIRKNPTQCCWACGVTLQILDRVYIKAAKIGQRPCAADFFLLCSLCRVRMPRNAVRDILLLWLKADFNPQRFRTEFLVRNSVSFSDVLAVMHTQLESEVVEKILRVGIRKVRIAYRSDGTCPVTAMSVDIVSRHLGKYVRLTREKLLTGLGGSLAQ